MTSKMTTDKAVEMISKVVNMYQSAVDSAMKSVAFCSLLTAIHQDECIKKYLQPDLDNWKQLREFVLNQEFHRDVGRKLNDAFEQERGGLLREARLSHYIDNLNTQLAKENAELKEVIKALDKPDDPFGIEAFAEKLMNKTYEVKEELLVRFLKGEKPVMYQQVTEKGTKWWYEFPDEKGESRNDLLIRNDVIQILTTSKCMNVFCATDKIMELIKNEKRHY